MVKFTMADVTLPVISVVRAIGSRELAHILIFPLELLDRDRTCRVTLTYHFQNGLAIDIWSIWTRASFEMVRNARGRSEIGLAERARHSLPTMNL